jgi:hypothetical protein
LVAPNKCAHGEKPITFNNPVLQCHVEVGAQTITGVKYINLADGTVTVEPKELTIQYNATGVGCPYGTTSNGLFTTGNTIIKGVKKGTATVVKLKWDA